MIYFVDIDDTVCTYETNNRSYPNAIPIVENLEKINKLYDQGHTIIYWTARGSVTGIDWTDITHKQLTKWGAKFHEIRMRKPEYDFFICDKAVNSKDFFKNVGGQS